MALAEHIKGVTSAPCGVMSTLFTLIYSFIYIIVIVHVQVLASYTDQVM